MATHPLKVRPLSRQAFAPFGEVLETDGAQIKTINQGTTQRFHALGTARVDSAGEVLINLFRAQPRTFPYAVDMMERHPFGSQAFYPLSRRPWLAVVAEDAGSIPGTPLAFLVSATQGVNYRANVWHHPLIAVQAVCDFLVIDRGGPGDNLEEYRYPEPYRIDDEGWT